MARGLLIRVRWYGARLIVDDSPIARATAGKVIADLGFGVIAAGRVEDAERVDVATLGAALLDVEIGDASGIELAQRLQTADSDLPIAFLTATSSSEAKVRATDIGPVFDKTQGLEPVAAWIAASVRKAP